MSHFKSVAQSIVTALLLGCSAIASAALIEGSVSSTDNLFYTTWNGTFEVGAHPDYMAEGSQAAQSFAGFNFVANGVTSFSISLSGAVKDAGEFATGPDGCPNPADACYFKDGNYNSQPVYSVIGVWSISKDSIDYISDGGWEEAVLYIGSGGNFTVPVGYENAYLFLAENDGYYLDNTDGNSYSVSVNTVPVPAAAWLFASALIGLGTMARKRG